MLDITVRDLPELLHRCSQQWVINVIISPRVVEDLSEKAIIEEDQKAKVRPMSGVPDPCRARCWECCCTATSMSTLTTTPSSSDSRGRCRNDPSR